MDFWHGMILGLFIGANTGVVLAASLKGCRRQLDRAADPADWLRMDEAVMEDAIVPVAKTPQPVISAAPHPFPQPGH